VARQSECGVRAVTRCSMVSCTAQACLELFVRYTMLAVQIWRRRQLFVPRGARVLAVRDAAAAGVDAVDRGRIPRRRAPGHVHPRRTRPPLPP
jgi:hypothetical protein